MQKSLSSEQHPVLIDIDKAIDGLTQVLQARFEPGANAVVEAGYGIAGYPVRLRAARHRQAKSRQGAWHLPAAGKSDPALTVEIRNDKRTGPANWAPWPEEAETNGTITNSEGNRYVSTQR